MVDDCADMFQQKKIKKWKAARRQSRDAHYELDWNIIGCVLIIIFCFLFRSAIALIRGPEVLEPCIELEPIAEPVKWTGNYKFEDLHLPVLASSMKDLGVGDIAILYLHYFLLRWLDGVSTLNGKQNASIITAADNSGTTENMSRFTHYCSLLSHPPNTRMPPFPLRHSTSAPSLAGHTICPSELTWL